MYLHPTEATCVPAPHRGHLCTCTPRTSPCTHAPGTCPPRVQERFPLADMLPGGYRHQQTCTPNSLARTLAAECIANSSILAAAAIAADRTDAGRVEGLESYIGIDPAFLVASPLFNARVRAQGHGLAGVRQMLLVLVLLLLLVLLLVLVLVLLVLLVMMPLLWLLLRPLIG